MYYLFGNLHPLSFLLFELMIIGLVLACLLTKTHHRDLTIRSLRIELVVIIFYGLFIETIGVAENYYHYGAYTISFRGVPIVIALGWAVICFTAMRFSDAIEGPVWTRPFTDGLFALLIDLGMDVIAIRDIHEIDGQKSGMWNFGASLDSQWFGVPYSNFVAWFLIIFIISSCLRFGRAFYLQKPSIWRSLIYPILSAIVALAIFIPVLYYVPVFNGYWLLFFISAAIIATIIGFIFRRRITDFKMGWLPGLVPTSFHLFFLLLLLVEKLYANQPVLIAIALGSFVLSELLILFALLILKKKCKP